MLETLTFIFHQTRPRELETPKRFTFLGGFIYHFNWVIPTNTRSQLTSPSLQLPCTFVVQQGQLQNQPFPKYWHWLFLFEKHENYLLGNFLTTETHQQYLLGPILSNVRTLGVPILETRPSQKVSWALPKLPNSALQVVFGFNMPGHIKLVKGAVDPDPTEFLLPSMDMKKADQNKPYEPKKSVWVPGLSCSEIQNQWRKSEMI